MLRTTLLLTLFLIFADTVPLGPDPLSHFIVLDATITAYSPSPAQTQGDPFVTASGRVKPQDLHELRWVAVSRNLLHKFSDQGVLNFGDKIFIEFTVRDTMHPRFTDRIDIFMRNENLALLFGKQERRVLIVFPSIENP